MESTVSSSWHNLHSSYGSATLRTWQQLGTDVAASDLVLPVFVSDRDDDIEPIGMLPGIYRYGVNQLGRFLDPLIELGLRSVLVFGVDSDTTKKDAEGTNALNPNGAAPRAIKYLRTRYQQLTVIADVCMCPYTSHGHCGFIDRDGSILNQQSCEYIAEIAAFYAQCGAQVVAPSDMMDGRIQTIKDKLISVGLGSKVAVMSYSAKFASSLYGPFRDAAHSAPAKGDRSCYQLPPGSRKLAMRASQRDYEQGADIIMVKPASFYLDIISAISATSLVPVAAYQVSGEYCMIYHAAEAGVFTLRAGVMESLVAMKRAGAGILITYYTPQILSWLSIQDARP